MRTSRPLVVVVASLVLAPYALAQQVAATAPSSAAASDTRPHIEVAAPDTAPRPPPPGDDDVAVVDPGRQLLQTVGRFGATSVGCLGISCASIPVGGCVGLCGGIGVVALLAVALVWYPLAGGSLPVARIDPGVFYLIALYILANAVAIVPPTCSTIGAVATPITCGPCGSIAGGMLYDRSPAGMCAGGATAGVYAAALVAATALFAVGMFVPVAGWPVLLAAAAIPIVAYLGSGPLYNGLAAGIGALTDTADKKDVLEVPVPVRANAAPVGSLRPVAY